MSLFSRLFGGSAKPEAPQPVTHNGFRIFPDPVKEPGGYRLAARIEKEIGDETKTHHMIRADVCHSAEEASDAAIRKAKSMIDQMGDKIF